MRILLDTHILLWFIEGDKRLPPRFQQLLNQSTTEKYISAVSFWELTIKCAMGKLDIQQSPAAMWLQLQETDARLLAIHPTHLHYLQTLSFHHRDPFDRLLIATALAENLTLISADQHFQAYEGLSLLWGDA